MFGPFERAVAGRYLRAREGERFVSVIAIFSLVGIALGVATLIIVMSVMSGFQIELLRRILGVNGHLGVVGRRRSRSTNYDAVADAHPRDARASSRRCRWSTARSLLTTERGGAARRRWCAASRQADLRALHRGQRPYRRRHARRLHRRRCGRRSASAWRSASA